MKLEREQVDTTILERELASLTDLASEMEMKFGEFDFVIQISIPLFCSKWLDNWKERWIAEHEGKSVEYPRVNGIKVVAVSGWFDNKMQLTAIKKSEYKE